MLFQLHLSFFVAAMSLASSVTASAILGRQASSCPNTLWCCDSKTPFLSLSTKDQNAFSVQDPTLNTDLLVGIGCNFAAGRTWFCTPRVPYFIRLTPRRSTTQLLCCGGVELSTGQFFSSVWPSELVDELSIRAWRPSRRH
ncbi:hypothetical protein EI94DRAFT_1316676 [Lactarius quietus]|nr:hypothetical protein EI94DRAFT_602860 [Lactarius quietus]KAF8267507.1 hypothetical protein EI94DRAFT_1316676 [Lactarius quietus]